MEAIQFIHAFSPIISKAAMQTYYSALPLMPSDSLLSKKYSAMSRPSLNVSGSRYSQIIHNPRVSLSIDQNEVRDSTSFGGVIVVSFSKGGIGFFDTSTGNQIGSRIPTPEYTLIASSPDGRRIATCHEDKCALDIWNVRVRTHAKAIAIEEFGWLQCQKIKRITFSVDGKKVIIITSPNHWHRVSSGPSRSTRRLSSYQSSNVSLSYSKPVVLPPRSLSPPKPPPRSVDPPLLVSILDVETDKLLKQLKVPLTACKVAMSDASQMVVADNLGIKIIDVSTGYPIGSITPFDDSPSAYDSTRLIVELLETIDSVFARAKYSYILPRDNRLGIQDK